MPPMRITSRGLVAVTVGLVSAVVLAGCSGNSSSPTVLPALTTSATPAATTTPAPASASSTGVAASRSIAPATSIAAAESTTPQSAPAAISTPSVNEKTIATVADVVKTYYREANSSLSDNASFPTWRGMFADSCTVCVGDYDAVHEERTAGSTYTGGEYHLKTVKVNSVGPNGAIATISYALPAAKLFSKSGRLLESTKPIPEQRATIYLALASGQWKLTFIRNVSD
jgi:hypothetical protein